MQRSAQAVTRREFLGATAAGLAAGRVAQPSTASEDKPGELLIVDCHAHIYGEDERKYPTIEKPYRPPEGKGTVAHLRQEMQACGVRYVTAIQTSTFYRWDRRPDGCGFRDRHNASSVQP